MVPINARDRSTLQQSGNSWWFVLKASSLTKLQLKKCEMDDEKVGGRFGGGAKNKTKHNLGLEELSPLGCKRRGQLTIHTHQQI